LILLGGWVLSHFSVANTTQQDSAEKPKETVKPKESVNAEAIARGKELFQSLPMATPWKWYVKSTELSRVLSVVLVIVWVLGK